MSADMAAKISQEISADIKRLNAKEGIAMKIKDCFKVKKVFGSYVMKPTGVQGNTVTGMIRLNQAGYDIWQWIDQGLEPVEIYPKYAEKYNVSVERAKQETDGLISQMRAAGVFEESVDWQHENLKDL